MANKTIVIGPKRGAQITRRWDPKEWRPEYEAMAALAATGMPHKEIASRFGYTEPWISSIMNSEKGKIVKQLLVNNIRNAASKEITSQRIRSLQARAFSNIEAVIENESLLERSPMAIFGASIEILKRTPHLGTPEQDYSRIPNSGNTTNTQVNFITPGVSRDDISKALETANEVARIHGPKDGE